MVAVISPWNFPLQLSNRSAAPALACGNAVVLKPTSDTPVAGGLLLARIFEEAGLDDADLDAAVFGSFCHAGQVCMIANRLVVDLAVYDEFVSRVHDLPTAREEVFGP